MQGILVNTFNIPMNGIQNIFKYIQNSQNSHNIQLAITSSAANLT